VQTHNTGTRCTTCHTHEGGFAASCSGCHGGGTAGTNQSNYWPDSGARGTADGATPNDAGAHFEHLRALARQVYNLSVTGLLDDVASDTKQKVLCGYCHLNPGADADHATGDDAAEVTNLRFFDGSADNGGSDPKGSVTDTAAAAWGGTTCTATDCHYEVTTTGWYAADQTGNADCTLCHPGITTHINGGCVSCHPGGSTTGNEKHTANAGGTVRIVPVPPASWTDPSGRLSGTDMRARLGLRYSVFGGIHLGGDSANSQAATEAEICWKCHDANGRSEWGYNTKTTPAGFPVVQLTTANDGLAQNFNFGWLYTSTAYTTKTSDWTAGYWMDQYDPLLRRRVVSVHSGSFDAAGHTSSVAANVNASGVVNRTSPVLEDKRFIRCTYCHDVHNLNRAPGDTASGKPHLRGTWIGSPYPPDLPPRARGTHPWMEGPRLVNDAGWGVNARSKGGYFIDQNSAYPTDNAAMDTLGETAGLCTLCHGTNVDTMDFYTSAKLWRTDTVNGHSNSTLGGTRANARNLFDAGPTGRIVPHGMTAQLELGQDWNEDGSFFWFYGDSGCDCPPGSSAWYPDADRANWYNAGGIGRATATGIRAHNFTCSKCHSPHATGLPALLVTNCIDVREPLATPDPLGPDYGWEHGLYNESSNCHRKTSAVDGWHRLAPRQ
ncbi:MAG: hypothetical protein IH608_01300, partial [Proteobacteria bacterium]|nr:hypothetical protein [Pseudomonadota bacterium]